MAAAPGVIEALKEHGLAVRAGEMAQDAAARLFVSAARRSLRSPESMSYPAVRLDVGKAYCVVVNGEGKPARVTRDAWQEAVATAAPGVIGYLRGRGLAVRPGDSPQAAATRLFVASARRRLVDEWRKLERRRRRMDDLGLPLL
ncbi:MAG: hypothetical protein M9894_00680 [Planctomycetes bacterium]|nr:hypothetical protein [Planctomycetota bacterium]